MHRHCLNDPSFSGLSSIHISNQSFQRNEHLFSYASGRWLWNEEAEIRNRYRYFNVDELKRAACRALDSSSCTSLEKIGEGGFNKVYRLVMQDGRTAIARIPHPNAGPEHLTTASEVATMDFARTVLKLPVPRVFGWSSNSSNPVEAEYILMEEAKGTQLNESWTTMSLDTKIEVVSRIVDIEKKLLSVVFSHYGSLYFRSENISGAVPAKILNDISQDAKLDIEARFDVGPSVRRELWTKERAEMTKYHGPWSNPVEWLQSVACCEMDWISRYAKGKDKVFRPSLHDHTAERSPGTHLDLLKKLYSVIPHILPGREEEVASSCLWHPDFHYGNIFVDDAGNITSLIDWQGAWLGPIFISAGPPKLLDYGIDMLMKLPDNFKQLEDDEKEKLRYQVSQSILINAYEHGIARENPPMNKVMRYPNGKTLKETVAFTSGTWEDGMLPLRECLIRIQRDWDYFDAQGPCPYTFNPEEIKKHQEEGALYNDNADFWKSLRELVDIDGYVHNEDFSQVVEIFRNMREGGLQELEGEDRDEFEKFTRWVVDIQTS